MTASKEIKGIGTTTIPDFAAFESQNKNYRRAEVSRIVPRDAYRRKERKSNEVNSSVDAANVSGRGENVKRIVYRVNEDGVSCVPDDRVDAIINGENADEGSESCDYYILRGDDEAEIPEGYTKQEYLLEKALSNYSNTNSANTLIEYLQHDDPVRNNNEHKSHDQYNKTQIESDKLYLSKIPLLLQDQIDIEAATQDAINAQEANKLACQLSLRTTACSTIFKVESTSDFEVIPSSNDKGKIIISAMTAKERQRLEQRRKQQEATLPYNLHGIELQEWESKINWEGASSDVEQDGETAPTESSYPDPQEILSQPFNTWFEGINLSTLISWEGADAEPGFNEALGKHLRKIVLQDTVAGASVFKTSGALPIPNPRPFNQSEEYKNRMERKNAGITSGPVSSLQTDMIKRNKEIEARQKKRAQTEIEKKKRIKDVLGSVGVLDGGTGRAITSSLMGPGGTQRTGRPTRHHGSSLAHDLEYIEQLEMINNHSLVTADLSPIELRHYSKPLLPKLFFRANEIMPWQLQVSVTPQSRAITSKTSSGATYNIEIVMPGSISQSKIRKLSDLSPLEGSLVLIEYSEEKLPIKLMKGMASKIVNYYKGDKSKCPISAGGGDLPTKKKKHGLSNQDSEIKGSSGKVEKPPRLEGPDALTLNTKDLIGKIGQKKYGDNNDAVNPSITKLPEGVTEILKDHGPFLGKVTDGITQTGIVNNLFVAPMARHEPKATDFLMILGNASQQEEASTLGVILRPMPKNIFIAGQTEPKRKVFVPDSKGDKDFITSFTTYHIAKALQSKHAKENRGLRFEEIKDGLFPFSDISANPLRQRIKKVALYDKNTQIWTLKNIGFEDFEGTESLMRSFTPEGVAAHWR